MKLIPHARVLASAGTGKTHRLTSRYLHLVLRGADPRTLLATTFTRAAAAEIRQRVLVRVAQALLEDSHRIELCEELKLDSLPPRTVGEILDRLLANLSELQICTIDSFISRLTTVGANELGLGTAPDLIRDDLDRGMQGKILRCLFDQLDSESELNAFAQSVEGLSKGRPPQSIAQTILKIVQFGLPLFHQSLDTPEIWRWSTERGIDQRDLGPLATALAEASIGQSKAICRDLQRLASVLEDLPSGENRFELLKEALRTGISPKLRSGGGTFGAGKNNQIVESVRGLVQQLNDYFDQLVIREYGRRTLATHDLLLRYHVAREQVRREEGVASFSDLVRALAEADPDLVRDELWFRLDGQIDHLLLDEFQDTSLMQWKVLRPLAEEIVSDGTGDRTLFCVGDVKQSIYGWRGGLPGILEHLPSLILEGGVRASLEEEILSKSWRTGPEILGVINHVFSGIGQSPIFAETAHLQEAARRFENLWERHEATPKMPSGCFELISSRPEGDSTNAASLRDAAASEAARLAADLHDQHPGLSIGVLTPKNKVAAQVVGLLRRRGLDATGDGGGSFLDCGATIVFLDALRLAIHPGDSAAFFNLCKSPLADVLECGCDTASSEHLARALRGAFASHGIARTFEDWVSHLGGKLDRREVGRLERLIIETQCLEAGGMTDLSLVRQELEALRLDEPGADSIRVMTIHGSKGLAFDLVILTGIDGQLIQKVDLVHERDPHSLELSRISRWVGKGMLPPSIQPLQSETQADQAFERLCQLYVAMTRARRGLFVVIAPPDRSGVAKVSMAKLVGEALLPSHAVDSSEEGTLLAAVGSRTCLPASGSPPKVEKPLADLKLRIRDGGQSEFVSSPSTLGDHDQLRHALPRSGRGNAEQARLFGTAMHGLLEMIEFIEDPLPAESVLRAQLRRVCPNTDASWQLQVLQSFREIIDQPQVRKALSRDQSIESRTGATDLRVLREVHWLRSAPDGRLQQGVIDRVLVFECSGVPVGALIIDWKTDRIDPVEADQHSERHQHQLGTYRAALAEAEGLALDSVEACVIYLRSDIRIGLRS